MFTYWCVFMYVFMWVGKCTVPYLSFFHRDSEFLTPHLLYSETK